MTPIELSADVLQRDLGMVTSSLADFSDTDFLARPVPGANHITWQLGHLISTETRMVNGIKPGAAAPLPADFEAKFTKETAGKDDAAFFPKRSQMLDQLTKTRTATIAMVKGLTLADWQKEGPEKMRDFIPTIGHALHMFSAHMHMHLGQAQVIRRKLGKPILF
jgi:uncharacterized damage-inducible protein DinB